MAGVKTGGGRKNKGVQERKGACKEGEIGNAFKNATVFFVFHIH